MPAAPGITSLQSVLTGLATGGPERVIGTKHSGPVGIESIIEYRGVQTVYLNVVDWVDTFLVTNITGIDGSDMRTGALPNPGGQGETPTEALFGGRTVVLTGKIYAQTIWKLRDMQQGLRGAFMDINHERPLIFHAIDPADDLMLMCKLADKISIPDQQTTKNGFVRDFQITLRASNPRFIGAVRQVNEIGFTSGGSYDDIAFSPYNNGNFTAQTTIELKGPMTNPRVLNEANNTMSMVNGTIPVGETWVFENVGPSMRFYRKSDGSNRSHYIHETSLWVALEPNNWANPIRFTASALTSASKVTMIHRHTMM